ncbi:hypothetical protein AVEN_8927-1 [Araneus ventricosus]|uniref:Uncharacterized protein n=1 Tax=Araneus ventricosus TaxID=182803 RepID=A0A4Y2DHE1_ARAVE|nr:hypothetical protein AVEN_8927-1 [Araneus ventricosus]
MSLACAECPLDIRESLAVQFFVDVIREEDTQLSTRLMDFTDLKSALAYNMKYGASKITSKISLHARPIKITPARERIKNLNLCWERWKYYWTYLLLRRKMLLYGIRTRLAGDAIKRGMCRESAQVIKLPDETRTWPAGSAIKRSTCRESARVITLPDETLM